MSKTGGLGKGLDSLLNSVQQSYLSEDAQNTTPLSNAEAYQKQSQQVALDRLVVGDNQPRKHFDKESLEQLAASIKVQGVIQPVVVRTKGTQFEIIAGERRWRGAKLANIPTIPIIVRDDLSEEMVLAVALIENMQREDLNAIEEAQALDKLVHSYHLTHEAVAQAVGKSRSGVTNALRLLELSENVQEKVMTGQLRMGHVRPLLSLDKSAQDHFADKIIENQWSARKVEQEIKRMDPTAQQIRHSDQKSLPENHQTIQKKLRKTTALEIRIRTKVNGSGEIVIPFADEEFLENIVERWFPSD